MTEKILRAFEGLEWHDAALLSLHIDRQTPGERDDVVLLIKWPDGRMQTVRFTDCYFLDVQMNFGVIAEESILSARCVAHSEKLAAFRSDWTRMGVDLHDLLCFEITTNSTASVIRVYAMQFEVSDP